MQQKQQSHVCVYKSNKKANPTTKVQREMAHTAYDPTCYLYRMNLKLGRRYNEGCRLMSSVSMLNLHVMLGPMHTTLILY